MQTRKLGFLTILIYCISFAMPALGADVAKIGIVDFQKILTASEAGKKAREDIADKGKAMEAELKAQFAELEEAKKRLEREALVMTQEKRSEKERELRIKGMDLEDTKKQFNREFNQMQRELVSGIQKKIFTIAGEIGKKEGYLLILEKATALYFPNSIDITDKIIQMYNEDYAKESTN